VIAIDHGPRQGRARHALGKRRARLDVAIAGSYTDGPAEADLVICAVQGEHALEAATSAAPLLKKGAHYLDLCTVTGKMSDEDRASIETAAGATSTSP
jgi:prephenate dehydrogenase